MEEQLSPRSVCMDVIFSIISKEQSRFCAAERTMVTDNVSPLSRTPLSNNYSNTPDKGNNNNEYVPKRFNFDGLQETVGAQKRGPKKNTIVEVQYKNLPLRADGADAMESLFEQGYMTATGRLIHT